MKRFGELKIFDNIVRLKIYKSSLSLDNVIVNDVKIYNEEQKEFKLGKRKYIIPNDTILFVTYKGPLTTVFGSSLDAIKLYNEGIYSKMINNDKGTNKRIRQS